MVFFNLCQVLTPRELDWPLASNVEFISCGSVHTLFLGKTDVLFCAIYFYWLFGKCNQIFSCFISVSGKVYSSGSNDFGQLGHEQARKRPRMSKFCM